MAKIRVAYEYSEAEDKSIRLGFFLMVSGIVSLFILGFCWLNPTLNNMQCKAANCSVVSLRQLGEMAECTFTCGADCKGTSLYPCLQIFVNNSQSNSKALLHYDEQQLILNPKCSYIPPCERDNQKNSENVMSWHDYWKEEIGAQTFICYINRQRRRPNRESHLHSVFADGHCKCNGSMTRRCRCWTGVDKCKKSHNTRPDDVLLKRAHDENVLLHCILWPLLTLLVGVLIVLLTICGKSLAVRAEALQKMKYS